MWVSHGVLANHGGLREEFGVGYEEENDLLCARVRSAFGPSLPTTRSLTTRVRPLFL
jgi:hypothetical protein